VYNPHLVVLSHSGLKGKLTSDKVRLLVGANKDGKRIHVRVENAALPHRDVYQTVQTDSSAVVIT